MSANTYNSYYQTVRNKEEDLMRQIIKNRERVTLNKTTKITELQLGTTTSYSHLSFPHSFMYTIECFLLCIT